MSSAGGVNSHPAEGVDQVKRIPPGVSGAGYYIESSCLQSATLFSPGLLGKR